MSWECKFLRESFCDKRKKECSPGAAGCVLCGKFRFPLQELAEETAQKQAKSDSRRHKEQGANKG